MCSNQRLLAPCQFLIESAFLLVHLHKSFSRLAKVLWVNVNPPVPVSLFSNSDAIFERAPNRKTNRACSATMLSSHFVRPWLRRMIGRLGSRKFSASPPSSTKPIARPREVSARVAFASFPLGSRIAVGGGIILQSWLILSWIMPRRLSSNPVPPAM